MTNHSYVVYAGTECDPVMLGVCETRDKAKELQDKRTKEMWANEDGTEAWEYITITSVPQYE